MWFFEMEWCEVYHPIALELDNVFGMKYGESYDFTTGYPLEGSWCYCNHEGELEGNRQKLWTLNQYMSDYVNFWRNVWISLY